MTDRETIINELHRLATDGIAPSYRKWKDVRAKGIPGPTKVVALFGSWSNAIIAAGLKGSSVSTDTPEMRAAIIAELNRLATDGTAPSSREWDEQRPPHLPTRSGLSTIFGTYAGAVAAAGLIAPRPGFKKGQGRKPSQLISMAQVDAAIHDDTGWTPDLPFELQRLAYLPSEGIPVSPPQVKQLWDWRRMTHITCEVYAVR